MTEQKIYDPIPQPAPEQSPRALPDEPYYHRTSAPQQNGSAARLGKLLVMIGLIWLAIELIGYGPFFGGAQGATLIQAPLPGNQVELDLGAGDVALQVGSDQDVHVELTQYGWWRGNPLVVSQLGDRVLVENEARPALLGLCFGRCGLSYQVTLPRDARLTVRTSSGDVTAEDLPGGLVISTSSGDVTLARVGGQLDVQTSSGDIELDGVSNALALQSNSGDIVVRDAHEGRLDIQTSSGDVEYDGSLANGDSHIATSSGAVTMRLLASSSFALDASSSSGELHSDFELRDEQRAEHSLAGVAGAGAARLKIETSSGDISVERQ